MKQLATIGILLLLMMPGFSQVRQERDYSRAYAVPENAKVEIVSKYGEVVVQTWDLDSVRFEVLVKAEGRNSSAVRKSMERVDIRFRKVGSIISATTEVSRSSGFLGDLMNEVEGVVRSNNKLQINYEVWIPEDVDVSVENKFGDIYLADLSGRLDLNISHGDIKANHLTGSFNIKHSYGKSSFGKLEEGTVVLRGAEFQVDEAKGLNLESGSSEVFIEKVDRIQFNSRNDKIRLSKVEEVICEGSFTDLTAEYIGTSARLDFNYGDIYLSRINRDFGRIDISGKSTDINLILNQASYIKAKIQGPEDRMILPNSMLTMQKDQLDDGIIVLSGEVGNTNTEFSQLNIAAESGELIIAIKDTPIFTDRD